MKVQQIMETVVHTCRPQDTADRAASLMWEGDCGVVPVVDAESKVLGMITDRDICMAGLLQGRAPRQIEVDGVMSRKVWACRPDDDLEAAERLMRSKKVRRLPVTLADGTLVGLLSLADIAVMTPNGDKKKGVARGGCVEAGYVLADICGPQLPARTQDVASETPSASG